MTQTGFSNATVDASPEVSLAFNPDEAGQTAIHKVADMFVGEELPVPKVVKLPPRQDVTDFFTGSG